MVLWLLARAVARTIEEANRAGVVPSVEQQVAYEASYYAEDGPASRILTVAGDVAQINVSGVITKAPSLMAMLFGGGNVTYPDIIQALAEADANPEVKRARLRVDSSGGHFYGLFETIAAIQSFSKPLEAVVHNVAASAAYALASQCDTIVAANRAVQFGSIGVAAEFEVDPNSVTVTSTEAPKKRPDVTTDGGRADVREELDALHDLFVEAIAAGRGLTVEKVNATFGRGSVFLSDEAKKRGMIDGIQGSLEVVKKAAPTATATTGGDNLEQNMDLITLKAQHPAVYAAAVAEGEAAERDRVTAHATMGEAYGDMATALKAIVDGSAMTATLTAKYMAAGANRTEQAAVVSDDGAVAAAVDAAAAAPTADPAAVEAEQVVSKVEALLGIKAGA